MSKKYPKVGRFIYFYFCIGLERNKRSTLLPDYRKLSLTFKHTIKNLTMTISIILEGKLNKIVQI